MRFKRLRDKIGSYKIAWAHVGRWIMHIPVGLLIAWMVVEMGQLIMGILLAWFFLIYETNEDGHYNDHGFIDIFGSMIGMVAGTFVFHYWI
ncbi:MAG: hypothetical protein KAR06_02725 [Deltaproteobacteria bacterium]|nr:hypothetical protein [Deltaproteobacteria bacterium]